MDQTIEWRCPLCCYSCHFTTPDTRFLAIRCPMCWQVSPLVGGPQLSEKTLREIDRAELRSLGWREPQPHDTPQATNVRVVPETCGLTAQERATSDRLLRLALEG